jgi:hypothetical protein
MTAQGQECHCQWHTGAKTLELMTMGACIIGAAQQRNADQSARAMVGVAASLRTLWPCLADVLDCGAECNKRQLPTSHRLSRQGWEGCQLRGTGRGSPGAVACMLAGQLRHERGGSLQIVQRPQR